MKKLITLLLIVITTTAVAQNFEHLFYLLDSTSSNNLLNPKTSDYLLGLSDSSDLFLEDLQHLNDGYIDKYEYLFRNYEESIAKLNLGINNTPTKFEQRIIINGDSTRAILRFSGDSLHWEGDMRITESAKKFIDYCDDYFYTKIDSLEEIIETIRKTIK